MSQARAASEPLLWLQLLGLSLLPLEALLLLLLLAGSDPGPLPALERLLCWAIGVLAPAVLFWRRPADVWSLLIVQTPARGRRDLQRRLSALQESLSLRLTLALGAALLLVLVWRLDAAASLAASLAPVPDAPRLVDLLLCTPLLALMLWEWQQAAQAVVLLSLPPDTISATTPLAPVELASRRLSLGLPLLLPAPLQFPAPSAAAPPAAPSPAAPRPTAPPPREAEGEPPLDAPPLDEALQPAEAALATAEAAGSQVGAVDHSAVDHSTVDQSAVDQSAADHANDSDIAAVAGAVEPEQAAEHDQGTDLDQPVD